MKTLFNWIVLAGLAGWCDVTAEIGPKVAPPSERDYSVEAIRESGERGGMLLTMGTNSTATDNRRIGEAMELWRTRTAGRRRRRPAGSHLDRAIRKASERAGRVARGLQLQIRRAV